MQYTALATPEELCAVNGLVEILDDIIEENDERLWPFVEAVRDGRVIGLLAQLPSSTCPDSVERHGIPAVVFEHAGAIGLLARAWPSGGDNYSSIALSVWPNIERLRESVRLHKELHEKTGHMDAIGVIVNGYCCCQRDPGCGLEAYRRAVIGNRAYDVLSLEDWSVERLGR